MADSEQPTKKADGKQRSLANLRPFKKGGNIPKSPGRPRSIDFAQAFRDHMNQGKRAEQLFTLVRKKKPDVAMYYLAGKPLEQVRIDATVTASMIPQVDILAAAEAAKKL